MGIIGRIRKNSWLAVLLVGIAIVAFIIGDLTKNNRSIPDLAKINGVSISDQMFRERTDELKEQVMRQQGLTHISNDMEGRIRDQVWQNILSEQMMGEQYDALGLEVSAQELSDMYTGEFIHPYLRQMFTDPQTGQYNTEVIRYYVDNFDQLDSTRQLEWIEVEKSVKQDRQMQKYTTLISQAMYTPRPIADKLAELQNKSASVRITSVPYYNVQDDEAVVADADYKKYYDEHRAEFRVREELRNLDYIVFPIMPTQADMDNIAKEVDKLWQELQDMTETDNREMAFFVNSESDRSYDSSYVRSTTFPAPFDSLIAHASAGTNIAPQVVGNQWMMAKVLNTEVRPDSLRASAIWILSSNYNRQITRTPEQARNIADSVMHLLNTHQLSFEEAVQQYSDNKENDGDMGWVTDGGYGFLNEQVIATPVDGIFLYEHPQKIGCYIVKVTGKTTPAKKYRVAMITRNIVPSEATEKSVYSTANHFAGQNRTHAALLSAASEQNLSIRNDMVNSVASTLGNLQNARSVVQWAFNDNTKEGEVADEVFMVDNAYVVASLKDIIKRGYAKLEQTRDMIEQGVRLDKKAEVLMERMAAVKDLKDIDAIAAKLGTTVDTMPEVKLGDNYLGRFGLEPKVIGSIAGQASKGAKGVVGPIRGANGVYMVQMDEVSPVLVPTSGEDIARTMTQQAQQKVNGVLDVLMDRAKIVDQRNKFF
ncbi:MAG: SurA N-terminal domain-containing protein [Bacteroidales bacterium]|nr:SurA N-terminal domain-containing protein [Bacteroidales bacterium]